MPVVPCCSFTKSCPILCDPMDCSTPEPQQHPTQQKACHWRRWYSVVYEAPLSTLSQALNTLEGGRHGWLYSFIRRALKLRKFERLVIGSLASHLWSWAWKTLLTLRAGFSLASQARPGLSHLGGCPFLGRGALCRQALSSFQ